MNIKDAHEKLITVTTLPVNEVHVDMLHKFMDEQEDRIKQCWEAYGRIEQQKTDLKYEVFNLQAKIDALMLEYCPEDMTLEQIQNYEKHQKAVEIK